MKKFGIINARLAGYIAGLGHMDQFMIGDGGMPIPAGVPIVDLALCGGVPTFKQVMDAVLKETEVEFYTVQRRLRSITRSCWLIVEESLPGVERRMVPHTGLKELSRQVKFAIRTGEFTPYPNYNIEGGSGVSSVGNPIRTIRDIRAVQRIGYSNIPCCFPERFFGIIKSQPL